MILTTVLIVLLTVLLVIRFVEVKKYKQLVKTLDLKVDDLQEQNKKEHFHRKSSEVRTGQMVEKMLPFTKDFKHNPRQAQFLGNPIDYIVFGDECITFVEVKTGKARLSQTQQKIKKLNGKLLE